MALPKTKPNSGFLFHEDGTIRGLAFYLHGGASEWLSAKLTVERPNGDVVDRVLFGGSAKDVVSISEDGSVLTLRDGASLPKSGLSMFCESVRKNADAVTLARLEGAQDHGLTNLKVKFYQIVNEKRTEKSIEKGRAKVNPKTGEYYKETDLVVEAVYGYETLAVTGSSQGFGGTGSAQGRGNLEAEAAKILQRVLDANKGSVNLSELRLKSIMAIGPKNPNNLAIQQMFSDGKTLIKLAESIGATIDGERIVAGETVPF